jgi:hypothetical protein
LVDPTTTLELRAVPACTVTGQVLLADGNPAAFVDVYIEDWSQNRWPDWMGFDQTTTARDGTFLLAGLHHIDGQVRVAIKGASGSACSEPFAIGSSGTTMGVPPVKLSSPAVVEGTVVDGHEHPAPGVCVWLRDWDFAKGSQKSGSVVEAVTDRQGRYRFVGVPPGGAWLQLRMDDSNPKGRAVEPFEIEPGHTYSHKLQTPPK